MHFMSYTILHHFLQTYNPFLNFFVTINENPRKRTLLSALPGNIVSSNSNLSSRQCLLTIRYRPWQASSTVGGHSVTKVLQLQNFLNYFPQENTTTVHCAL